MSLFRSILSGGLLILLLGGSGISVPGQIYQEKDLTEGRCDTAILLKNTAESRRLIRTDPKRARELATETFQRCKTTGFNNGARLALEVLIELNIQNKNFDLALKQISLAMQYCEALDNRECKMTAYHYKGLIYQNQGKYQESLEAYIKAVNYAPDNYRVGNLYNNIGGVLGYLGETEKAISFYKKALSSATTNHQQYLSGFYHINMARGQISALDFEKSKQSLDSGISLARIQHQKEALIYGLMVKADLYIKMEQYREALIYIQEARSLTETSISDQYFRYLVHIIEGLAYSRLNQFKEAERCFQKAEAYIAKMTPGNYVFFISVKADHYYRKGNYKLAYELARQTRQLADSLKAKEVRMNVNELETRFRTAEKDKEIALRNLQISDSRKKVAQQNMILLSVLFGFTLLIILGLWYLLHQRKQQKHKNELEHLKGRIEGEEEERARLAQDLHDDINSQLTAIQSFLQAEANLNPGLKQSANFTIVQNMLQHTASGVRQIAHNMAPEQLLKKGLATVIEDFCQGIFSGNTLKAHIDIYGDFSGVSAQLCMSIYRIVQELAQNIRKHAGATEATVILYKEDTQITLIVEDNGKGMDEEQLIRSIESKGIGLWGIQKRVKLHQGTFTVNSTIDHGVSVHITFPLQPESA